jgi:hypothetical protein
MARNKGRKASVSQREIAVAIELLSATRLGLDCDRQRHGRASAMRYSKAVGSEYQYVTLFEESR